MTRSASSSSPLTIIKEQILHLQSNLSRSRSQYAKAYRARIILQEKCRAMEATNLRLLKKVHLFQHRLRWHRKQREHEKVVMVTRACQTTIPLTPTTKLPHNHHHNIHECGFSVLGFVLHFLIQHLDLIIWSYFVCHTISNVVNDMYG